MCMFWSKSAMRIWSDQAPSESWKVWHPSKIWGNAGLAKSCYLWRRIVKHWCPVVGKGNTQVGPGKLPRKGSVDGLSYILAQVCSSHFLRDVTLSTVNFIIKRTVEYYQQQGRMCMRRIGSNTEEQFREYMSTWPGLEPFEQIQLLHATFSRSLNKLVFLHFCAPYLYVICLL